MSAPEQARRSGLEALRAVLRRRHPGFDVVFVEVERDDGVDNAAAGEVVGCLPAPGMRVRSSMGSTLRPRPRERRTNTVSMKPASTSRRSGTGRAR
jgi:hypothetical protein